MVLQVRRPLSSDWHPIRDAQPDTWSRGRTAVLGRGVPSPVSQPEHEELEEGRVNQQGLVIPRQIGESRQAVGPGSCHLHGAGQQSVEEMDVLGV